jgi:hypothetical protein
MVDTLTRQTTSTDDMPPAPFTGADAPSLHPASASDRTPQTVLETSPLEHQKKTIPISARLNQFTSGYWSLMMSFIGVRYLAQEVTTLFYRIKENPQTKEEVERFKDKSPWQGAYAAVTGLGMTAISGYYAISTAKDLKTVFAQSIGWELNKPADKVSFLDIWKSRNELVVEARHNYVKYNIRRFAVNAPLFFNWIPPIPKFGKIADGNAAVNMGLGSNAAYLTYDIITRKETFFERLQGFADAKINHANQIGEHVTADDLINLYLRHSRDRKHSFVMPQMSSPEWQNNQKLFGRMADLMNQTYKNVPDTEHADFTLDKFLYLIGTGLIKSQAMENNLAYVEVANSAGGIDAVKDVACQVGEGRDILAAAAPYLASPSVQQEIRNADALEHEAMKSAVVGNAERILADARADSLSPQLNAAEPSFVARLEPRGGDMARQAPPASFAEAASQRQPAASPSL